MKTKILSIFLLLFVPDFLFGAYSNYNSILVGERAAGMGGAYTALSGDAAAVSYYNPATLAQMKGASLSATANLYNKYDIRYGDQDNFDSAVLRANEGTFVPIPSSSGSVYRYKKVALGLSIIFPDLDTFIGNVSSSGDDSSNINLRDESLWVGGSISYNLSSVDSAGITFYYTSRTYTRSLTDQSISGGTTTIFTEEKLFTTNSLVGIIGYWRRLSNEWTAGLSYRIPSFKISGIGNYFQSTIDTTGTANTPYNRTQVKSESQIPTKLTLGIAYEREGNWAMALDISSYGPLKYNDLDVDAVAETVEHIPIVNINFGGEYYLNNWLAIRYGLFTNFSSRPKITQSNFTNTVTDRRGDHIDMWGFSTNFAIHTTGNSLWTLGGYYSGGKGHSTQRIGQKLVRIEKSTQVFSFLVGKAFQF